jgi:hypothetical protein
MTESSCCAMQREDELRDAGVQILAIGQSIRERQIFIPIRVIMYSLM